MSILISFDTEINAFQSFVNVLLFEDGRAGFVRSANHVPVDMKDVESAVIGEGLGVSFNEGTSEQVHVHLVVATSCQLINV